MAGSGDRVGAGDSGFPVSGRCRARGGGIPFDRRHRLPHTPRFRLNASLSQSFSLSALVLDYVVSIGWRSEQHRTIFNGRDFLQPDDPRLRLDDLVESFWSVDAGAGATWNQAPDRGFRQQRDRRGA